MSKVIQKHDSWMMGKRLDCGHILFDFGDNEGTFDDKIDPYKEGDEVDCPVCADTAMKVKAARVTMLDYIESKLGELEGLNVIIEEGASEGYYISQIDIEETFNDLAEAENAD